MRRTKLKAICIVAFMGLMAATALAQPPDTLWTRTFGGMNPDAGFDIGLTTDGGFVVSGYTHSEGLPGQNGYLIKTDSGGYIQWSNAYRYAGARTLESVMQTSDGGFVATGAGVTGQGSGAVFVTSVDYQGDTVWTRLMTGWAADHGKSILRLNDSEFLVLAGDGSTNRPDIRLVKFSINGDTLWSRAYGGDLSDVAFRIRSDNYGAVVLGGSSRSSSNPEMQFLIGKIDTSGTTIWLRLYGGGAPFWLTDLEVLGNGEIVAIGWRETTDGNYESDGVVMKLSAEGDSLWTRFLGNQMAEFVTGIEALSDDMIIVTGTRSQNGGPFGNALVIAINGDGDSVWELEYPLGTYSSSAHAVPIVANDFAVVGSLARDDSENLDIWVARIGTQLSANLRQTIDMESMQTVTVWPNPFNSTASILFHLQRDGNARMRILGIDGRMNRMLLDRYLVKGSHAISFNGTRLASGTYFVAFETETENSVFKIVLTK